MTRSGWLLFGVKLGVTAALIAYLTRKVDVSAVLQQLRGIDIAWGAMATAMLAMQLVLVALRWQVVSRVVDARMRTRQIFRLTLIGQFFSQVLPSAVGGDAVRAWLAVSAGVPVARAVSAIVCDRAAGFVVLTLIIACTLLFVPLGRQETALEIDALRIVAVLGVAGIGVLILLGERIAKLFARYRFTAALGGFTLDLRRVFCCGGPSLAIMGLAVTVQVLLVAVVCLCARSLHVELQPRNAALVVPAVMLVTMIPISLAGWGVRESAMVFGLGLVGVAAAEALAISVTFGLMQIVIGLPGGWLWLSKTT